MIEQDKRKFKELMAGVGEVYGKDITKPLLSIYFNALEDLSIEQAAQAFTNHVRSTGKESTFFPKPADLIRQIQGSTEQKKEAVEDRAMIAWACVEGAISRIGPYGTLKLDDKQAMAAVKTMGGWQSLCRVTYDQMTWKKKEFIEAYKTFDRTPIENLPAALPGIHELAEHKKESGHALSNMVAELNQIEQNEHE